MNKMKYNSVERILIKVYSKLFLYTQKEDEVSSELLERLYSSNQTELLRLKENILLQNFMPSYFDDEVKEIDYLFHDYVYDLDFEKKEIIISKINLDSKFMPILKGKFTDDIRIFYDEYGFKSFVNVKEEEVKENYEVIKGKDNFYYLIKDGVVLNKKKKEVELDTVVKKL